MPNHKIYVFVFSLTLGCMWVACDKVVNDVLPQTPFKNKMPTTIYLLANSSALLDLSLDVPTDSSTQFALGQGAVNGFANLNGRWLSYTPFPFLQSGMDSFTLQINGINTQIRAIIVPDSAALPCSTGILPVNAVSKLGMPITMNVLGNAKFCKGTDSTSLNIVENTYRGTLSVVHNTLYYQPYGGAVGFDYFKYSLSSKDPKEGTGVAQGTIYVTDQTGCIDSLPNVQYAWKPAVGETSYTIDILSKCKLCDLDSNTLTITGFITQTQGTAVISNGKIVYTPKNLQPGYEIFAYGLHNSTSFYTGFIKVQIVQ